MFRKALRALGRREIYERCLLIERQSAYRPWEFFGCANVFEWHHLVVASKLRTEKDCKSLNDICSSLFRGYGAGKNWVSRGRCHFRKIREKKPRSKLLLTRSHPQRMRRTLTTTDDGAPVSDAELQTNASREIFLIHVTLFWITAATTIISHTHLLSRKRFWLRSLE